jgi:polyisoprenoid-binding protein YceI
MGSWVVVFALLQAAGGGHSYAVDPSASRVSIKVGRAGLLKMAGHEHTVVAEGLSGDVQVDASSIGRSSVRVLFAATAVRVADSEALDDVPKVQDTMAGPKVLDVERFPEIRFASTAVSGRKGDGGTWDVSVVGDLELHGVKRSITVPLRVVLGAESLVAEGTVRLVQRDFGIEPVSVGGVVKVKDELELTLKIVARPTP